MTTGNIHLGTLETCKGYLQSLESPYIYILRRPDGRPFYIGKGGGGKNKYRVFDHENEARHPNDRFSNAHKLNVIRSIWRANKTITYEIDSLHHDEVAAYKREAHLITFFKRLHEGGILTNLAPGGGSIKGASPISLEKHSATLAGIPEDNPERATLNGFVLGIYPEYAKKLGSIPIKPLSQHAPKPTQAYPTKTIGQTLRQAVAIVSSAAANGASLDKEARIPRLLIVEGIKGVIESGVCCDILSSGMANIVKEGGSDHEVIILTSEQAKKVTELVGIQKCFDLGVLTPR